MALNISQLCLSKPLHFISILAMHRAVSFYLSAQFPSGLIENGAGEGNRTPAAGLEGQDSTIKLHLLKNLCG